jgi:alkane 1-monooxygenase
MYQKFRLSDLKYLAVLSIPLAVFASLYFNGINSYIVPLGNFIIVPILDLLFPEDKKNPNTTEAARLKVNPLFDWLLYFNVLCQFALLFYTLYLVIYTPLATFDKVGKIWSMGICTAVLGINTAHELGHRKERLATTLAKLNLMTASYMHFFIEHNRGHHHHVATPLDPATAKKNQTVYSYYLQSVIGGYKSAWRLANDKAQRLHGTLWSLKNEMIQFSICQILFYVLIAALFTWKGLLFFFIINLIGIKVLETINYVEHYGLMRNKQDDGTYEKVKPWHSWNSDHVLGRIMLLELTRHSDHHYRASKKYQTLERIKESPQLPLGYPGSMVLSWFPPLWFKIMNKRLEQKNHQINK